jgi:Phage tail tube protein
MGWGADTRIRITKESTYGVYDSGALTANIIWYRLASSNAFTMRAVPQRKIIRSADGGNRRRQVVATRKVCVGNLTTLFYPTQAAKMFDAAITLTSNQLASYTIDFWDSVAEHRFLGCMVSSLSCQGSAEGDYIPMTVGFVAQKQDTPVTLTAPADTVFPTETPYTHHESMGLLSIGGTVTKYKSLGFSLKNILSATWDEDQWITACYYSGRDLDLSVNLQYVSSTLRTALEAQSALTITSAWTRTAGLTTTLDLKTKSYVASVGDDIPLGGAAYQQIGIEAFYDQGSTTDFSYTVA